MKALILTLEQLWAIVGTPAKLGATHRTWRGDVMVTSWADTLGGHDGWWFALHSGADLIAIGWTSGGRRDRDDEIARAFLKRSPPRDRVRP